MLNMFRTLIYSSWGAYDYSVELPHLFVLFLVRCVLEFRCGWIGVVSVKPATRIPLQPNHTETHRTKNNTTNVIIQQNSRKLLKMDILMSEICWAHKKWNKIASDIKLVFYSSTITMMHGPINIRFFYSFAATVNWEYVTCQLFVSSHDKMATTSRRGHFLFQ